MGKEKYGGVLRSWLPRVLVYGDIWEAVIGEELDCQRDPSNAIDRYAVAVVKSGTVVGHLPKKLSRIYSLFIRRGGVVRSMCFDIEWKVQGLRESEETVKIVCHIIIHNEYFDLYCIYILL